MGSKPLSVFMRMFVGALIILLMAACPSPTGGGDPGPAGGGDPGPDTDPVTVNLAAIAGVTAPVFEATPVTTITETAQYTGTVSWNPADATFAAVTEYTATISLTAKTGYSLTGVTANFFTVAGATATNSANSGVVTAVFPATGGSYTSTNIGTLLYVPAGRFQRDLTEGNISVITQPYRMSQYEITRAQFQAIMGTDPVVAESQTAYSSGTSDPVMFVNWYHAIAFCNKLSVAEGLTPVYSVSVGGTAVDWSALTYDDIPTTNDLDWNAAEATWTNNGYRLPTEMEWMWAAMGAPEDGQGVGTNTTGYLKAFAGSTGSNAIADYAVFGFGEDGGTTTERTNPVGSKLANELGLYDMSGNVSEWTWDVFQATIPAGIQTDYKGGSSDTLRVVRGGGWDSEADDCSVGGRGGNDGYISFRSGFRVVRP